MNTRKKLTIILVAVFAFLSLVAVSAFAAGEYPTIIDKIIEENEKISINYIFQSVAGVEVGSGNLHITGKSDDCSVQITGTNSAGNTIYSQTLNGTDSFQPDSISNGDTIVVTVLSGSARVYANVANGKLDINEYVTGTCGDNVHYELNTKTGEMIISGTGDMSNYAGPSSVPWYDYRGIVSKVEIEEFVTSIGRNAFIQCTSLTSVSISESVLSIGDMAFFDCTSLTSVTIPETVITIGGYAFNGCSDLTSVSIPSSVTAIGSNSFVSCTSLASIIVDEKNEFYDSRNNCNALIETSTNTLIVGCKNTTIPDSVTSIGNCAFDGCSGLTSIMIPTGVTNIGDFAFYGCSLLTSVLIPESVSSIGDNSFAYCRGLTSLSIPDNLTNIGEYAFKGCSGLVSIFVDEENVNYDSRNNCNAIIETSTNTLLAGCINTIIPDSVTSIGGCAFDHCIGLTAIIIPESVTSIGEYAFRGCTGLSSITIPNRVTNIGDYAFYGCDGFTSFIIPSSVTNIGNRAFSKCINLTSVEFLGNIESVDSNAFADSDSLKYVVINNNEVSFCDWGLTKNTKIVAYEDSASCEYAQANGYDFIPILDNVAEIKENLSTIRDDFSFYFKSNDITIEQIFEYNKAYPQFGDYLRFSIDGTLNITKLDEIGIYQTSANFHTTAEQEELINEFINNWYSENETILNEKTDEEKARFIYDFLCENISTPADASEQEMFDTWSALINGRAYCQGFALAFYRLALRCGLDARIVTSAPEDTQPHAWNIVKIGDLWYHVDASAGAEIKNFQNLIEAEYGEALNSTFTQAYLDAFFMAPLNNGINNSYVCRYDWQHTAPEIQYYPFADANNEYGYAHGTTGSLEWSLNLFTGELLITGNGEMPDYTASEFAPWTAYALATGLRTVVIAPGVTSVGDYAFIGCSDIENIYLPDSITDISDDAFDEFSGIFHCGKASVAEAFAIANGYDYHNVIQYTDETITVCGYSDINAYGFCEDCESPIYFTDRGVFEASGHKLTTTLSVAPTCVQPGYTEKTYCTVCGTVFVEANEIPATGEHIDADGDNHCDDCGTVINEEAEEHEESIFVKIINFFKSFFASLIKKLNKKFKK